MGDDSERGIVMITYDALIYVAIIAGYLALLYLTRPIPPQPPAIVTEQQPIPSPPLIDSAEGDVDPGVNALPILKVNLPEQGMTKIGGVFYWKREGMS